MSNMVPRRVIVTVIVFISVIGLLVLHGINKEYSGVLNSQKSGFVDVARLWRDSGPKEGSGQESYNTSSIQWQPNLPFKNSLSQQGIKDTQNSVRILESDGPDTESKPSCKRRNNIGFFKMHKCGSSTVQNILMRYGVRHLLNFVLPPSGNYLGQTFFNKRFMMIFPVHEYNILCHHTRFSKEGFASVLPSDSAYVTIIRDPATMFESTYTYLQYQHRYGVPLTTFLENPSRYYDPNGGKNHAKDSMLFDLGLEEQYKTNVAEVDKKIQRIASEFDLVMMTEHFSESLILLKELMCWDFQDIAYFKMNARSPSSVKSISDTTMKKIRQWNDGDTKLYNFFNRTFWDKVRAFGEERMRREVAKLEEINQMMKDRCIDKVITNDQHVWHPSGIAVESFKLKPSVEHDEDCQLMAKTELPFTAYVRQRQLAKYFGHKAPVL